jgi:hypothetical protein
MLLALTLAALLAAPPLEPATQLSYTGTMVPLKDDGNPATKQFDLTYVVLAAAEDKAELAWTLAEAGRGGWTWLDRFGRLTLGEGDGGQGPALLYQREDGRSIVPLVPPLFHSPVPLARGAEWEEGRLAHRVSRETTKAGRSCWEIEIRSPYGRKRTVWVERDSPLVVAVQETVFIGQGEEHRLSLELAGSERLSADDLARTAAALDAWLDLRRQIDWTPRSLRTELTDEQIAALRAGLAKLESHHVGPLAAIGAAAKRQTQEQRSRLGAVAALRESVVGQPLGELTLPDLAGRTLPPAEWAGKVVVLHFWEYRDVPLEEPYGQVGYLDYLARRRADDGVVVLGVNVDDRLADADTRRASINAARKLKSFMNVSYPILLDDGSLLKRLGDPRPGGGKLPLFVVIGRDGKVAAYHAGLYDVKANDGLAQLNSAIDAAGGAK